MRALAAAAALTALSLAGCATLPDGHRWGGDVTVAPGWARVRSAAVSAATDPWVWAPLAGAAALQIGNVDHRISRWGRTHDPLFGSEANATLWSDRLRSASVGVDIATLLFTPSGDAGGPWLLDKARGYLVNLAAATSAIESTTLIHDLVRRERPNRANDHSFPSGHSAASSVYTRLATLNLQQIPMGASTRDALEVSFHALSFATAWARVEGGWHYPSDTLASMAIGNFFAQFFTATFMGLDAPRERFAFAPLPGGGALTFAVALGPAGR
ncbi:MAG TPA: phosphatase PAP2 family protein [Steroidobacteraceae bacterium]|nr:phosphatase PAP2 family protein [Steroidobacteraceae bacterium]